MRTIALALRYLWSRPLPAVLNLVLLTMALASITFVLLTRAQVERAFGRDLAGVDLVVGAKGSPMQLILAGLLHIDEPPGMVRVEDLQRLRAQPEVGKLIPLALGDTLRGYRIVGTTPDFLAHYQLKPAQGQAWTRPMEALLGADVARTTALVLGDSFAASHGLAGGVPDHPGSAYRVKGVLAPCGCVADRLVLTAVESVWQIHPRPQPPATEQPEGEPERSIRDEREVSLALVTYKSPQAAATLPRWIHANTPLQAAAPAEEVSRFLRTMGVGIEVLRGVGAVLLLMAALSLFIALWNGVRERREDLAMLRMLGATPSKVAALLLCEALWLAVMASALGLLAGHAMTSLVGGMLAAQNSLPVTGGIWVRDEIWVPLSALLVAVLAALVPSLHAYRIDVAHLLNGR